MHKCRLDEVEVNDVVEVSYHGKTYWAKFKGQPKESNHVLETRSYLFLTHKGYRRFKADVISEIYKYDLMDRIVLWIKGIRMRPEVSEISDL